MNVPDPLTPDDRHQSFNGWTPETPYDKADFARFEQWVDDTLRPYVVYFMGEVPSEWTLLRERARTASSLRYWLVGVLAAAENYLAAAKRYASFIREQDLGEQAKSEKLKARMEDMVRQEKHLVHLLQRYLDAMDRDISWMQSESRGQETEMQMAGRFE